MSSVTRDGGVIGYNDVQLALTVDAGVDAGGVCVYGGIATGTRVLCRTCVVWTATTACQLVGVLAAYHSAPLMRAYPHEHVSIGVLARRKIAQKPRTEWR